MKLPTDPLPITPEDIDVFVWVWNAFESSWMHVTAYTAETFFRVYPERYTGWLPHDALPRPPKCERKGADNEKL